MIFKSNFPNAPTVNMVIDGVAVDYTAINAVSVSFAENEHDYAEFSVSGLIPSAVTEYINRPVYISIAYGPTNQSFFHGYIAFIEPVAETRKGYINNSAIQHAKLICFGTSYDMGNKRSKVWENHTLKRIVETLASDYKYSFQIPTDSFVFSRLTQDKETDFAFLVKVCKSLGYRVTVSNGHIHVYDPFASISRAMPYAELTNLVNSQGNATYSPGRIMEFRGTFGSRTTQGSSDSFTFETMDNNGQLITHSTGSESMDLGQVVPARFNNTVTMNTFSQEALKKYALGAVKNRAPFHAEAIVTGLPEVLPGSLVKLSNYNGKFDGFWMVSKVTQNISRSNYTTELSLVKDSTNDALPVITSGTTYIAPQQPVVIGGTWVSPLATGYAYA
jgi:phage protein D